MTGNSPAPAASLLAWGLHQVHERLIGLVADLTYDQLSWKPQPDAHSLGFAFWHIARCDDNYLRMHIQGRREIWQEEEWFRRWSLDSDSTGMLLSDEEASALPLPDKSELLMYVQRVWGEVESFVTGLDQANLDEPMAHVQRTSGMTLGQVLTTHIYGHDNRHLGEMEYVKGLLGMRGSVTL